MPSLNYSDEQIREKATELGLAEPGGEVSRRHRGKVVAALAAAEPRTAQNPGTGRPTLPDRITVQPHGDILIDGEPLPWLVSRERIEVVSNPDGPDTVRLTLLAEHVSITDPAGTHESENRA